MQLIAHKGTDLSVLQNKTKMHNTLFQIYFGNVKFSTNVLSEGNNRWKQVTVVSIAGSHLPKIV